jgi:ferritin
VATEKSRLSLTWLTILGMAGTLLSLGFGSAVGAFAWRSEAVDELEQKITTTAALLRKEQEDTLRHFVSTEAFLRWSAQERVRSDGQFYKLLNKLDRLDAKLERR